MAGKKTNGVPQPANTRAYDPNNLPMTTSGGKVINGMEMADAGTGAVDSQKNLTSFVSEWDVLDDIAFPLLTWVDQTDKIVAQQTHERYLVSTTNPAQYYKLLDVTIYTVTTLIYSWTLDTTGFTIGPDSARGMWGPGNPVEWISQ